jgi:hypothetical protein
MNYHLRIARPVTDLASSQKMYCEGLNFSVVGHFENHQGFSGVMLGSERLQYHLEFTVCHDHAVSPSPTAEDLLVLYIADIVEFQNCCQRMIDAGFEKVSSFNPYWDHQGQTFRDHDGYRVVLQNDSWQNVVS